MKKSTILLKTGLVMALSVILVAFSVGTPTFSWFDRTDTRTNPQTKLTGNGLAYAVGNSDYTDSNDKSGLYAYDGNSVTITANQYSSDGISYSAEGAVAAFKTSNTLAAGKRDFYKTTLKNSGTVDQNVSLYIQNLKTTNANGELCVGVNSPVKAYKNYSEIASNNNENVATKTAYTESPEKVRVYLNPKNAWTYAYSTSSDNIKVDARYGNVGDGTWTTMTYIGKNGDGEPIYYVDIYKDSTFIQFHVNGNSDNWSWTQTKTGLSLSSKQSVVFWAEEDHGTDDGTGKLKLGGPTNVDGPYFNNTFNDSTSAVYMRSTQSFALVKDTDYKGKSATYTSTNTNVFTVNKSTGVVTPKATGYAYVKVTIAGAQYGDTKEIQYKVTVKNIATGTVSGVTAPVITNVLIPAGEEVDVHWFIMNDLSASSNVFYSLSKVYIGL